MSAARPAAREPLAHRAWSVAPGAWVALALPESPCPSTSLGGRERRVADRRAGRVAAVVALRAAGLAAGTACVSRSHSAGAGAAVAAPAGWSAGVDVTPIGRVTLRHARAVAAAGEIAAVEAAAAAPRAAALVWALKEAAVKAAGRRGLGAMPEWAIRRVGAGAGGGWAELACSVSRARVLGGWQAVGDFVCAWAVAPPTRFCWFDRATDSRLRRRPRGAPSS